MDAIRVIRILRPMLLTRCHGHATALTAQGERHRSDKNKTLTRSNNLTGRDDT
jgi:hypothetical protein